MKEVRRETARLIMRPLTLNDVDALKVMMQDEDVMKAWEHTFTEAEIMSWVEKQMAWYERDGVAYFAVIERESQQVIGQCGLRRHAADDEWLEIGWLFAKSSWHQGYAFEAASAWLDVAFNELQVKEVRALIRPMNEASTRLAKRLKMNQASVVIKVYKGQEMPHTVYTIYNK